ARLLEACRASRTKHLASLVTIALESGLRRSELLGLTWDRVDFSRGVLRLEKTKSGKRREVPMRQAVYEVLAALPGRRSSACSGTPSRPLRFQRKDQRKNPFGRTPRKFLQRNCCTSRLEVWSRRRDLNPRPADYESAALPLSYTGFSQRRRYVAATAKGTTLSCVVNSVGEFWGWGNPRSITSACWKRSRPRHSCYPPGACTSASGLTLPGVETPVNLAFGFIRYRPVRPPDGSPSDPRHHPPEAQGQPSAVRQ